MKINQAVYNKEETPIVSVIMPAYRCAKTINQAIDSVLRQEVPLELIVVNDCSPDELDAALQRYADDPRVHCRKLMDSMSHSLMQMTGGKRTS